MSLVKIIYRCSNVNFVPPFSPKIEENTRILAKLGQRFGSPAVGRSAGTQTSGESEDDARSTSSGRASSAQDRWKVGAKKALLQWCRAQVTDKFGIQVGIEDFCILDTFAAVMPKYRFFSTSKIFM